MEIKHVKHLKQIANRVGKQVFNVLSVLLKKRSETFFISNKTRKTVKTKRQQSWQTSFQCFISYIQKVAKRFFISNKTRKTVKTKSQQSWLTGFQCFISFIQE